jgi:hypothetical protein
LVIAFAFLALAAGAHAAPDHAAPAAHPLVVNGSASVLVTDDTTAIRVQDAEHTNASAARHAAPAGANPPRSTTGTPDRTATVGTGTRPSTDGSRAPPRVA